MSLRPGPSHADGPFPRELAFLPADSTIPWGRPLTVPAGSSARHTVEAALARVAGAADDVLRLIDGQVVPMSQLVQALAPLNEAMAGLYALVRPALQELSDGVDHVALEDPGPAADAGEGAPLPEGIVIDHVFRVIRVPALAIGQFAAQVAATCRGVLTDLPHVLLGIDEITAVVRTIRMMCVVLARQLVVSEGEPQTFGGASACALDADPRALEPHGLTRLWTASAGDPQERTAQLASYRWLLGVHFFNLATLFCRDALMRARLALERGDDSGASEALGDASLFLRGTTAAMWYSGNFSAGTYQRYIRPAIVRPGTSEGLSGGEMIDYKEMKAEKERLKAALVARHGRNPETWPPPVADAIKEFRATYIEDMEHHMRLASARIGGDISLTQKAWQDELPVDVTLKSAVEVLRDMAALRRQEFPL